ncbi:GntR family transcriptional regulator/MocR family aminotransferase [Natronospira proteinivora]|uniref:GntR family transcriptional regulator/MocR family aminotransferase n=1 Tax=Natronospira proteinivora TaxID=1807133 RepID=A0ABT1G8D3_9GAMM|nr:PLP-dependent aminotransferase family protein [Natronospira proteinivora]MCP1727574.1 GntR family transcriptional regulator/MocR family aminotransferase [Natronospira proteinivora]
MFIRLDGEGPIYRQIYRQVRDAILAGQLPPGSRLPATRPLARKLGVARITVIQAYEQLDAEGYLDSRRGAGTRVAAALEGLLEARFTGHDAPIPRLSSLARYAADNRPGRPVGRNTPILDWDFQYGRPAVSREMLSDWRRSLRQAAISPRIGYPDPMGEPDLRESLAAHLREHRGLLADPARIMVVSGTQQALDLIGRCILNPGDGVVLEEPQYQGTRHAFSAIGARLLGLPVDGDGLRTATLPDDPGHYEAPIKLACVTPSHQFPLGGVLPVSRRLALLQWASRQDAWIIEDDYDSDYRHEGGTLQSLYSLDRSRRVIYIGTFSKVLFPGLRLGYLVLPSTWVEPMRQLKWLNDRGSPALEQRALAELFRSGAFRRHLERNARQLSERREALVAALREHFGQAVEILGARAGMHLVARWPDHPPEQSTALIQTAAKHGIGIYATSPYYLHSHPTSLELLLGYATLEPEQIREGIKRLKKLWSVLH